jgi:hypothetical protein
MGDTWYLDELFVNIQGRQQYLWRAVDEDFKSALQVQRFATEHGLVQNLFRVGRHLPRSAHHRLLRGEAFRV